MGSTNGLISPICTRNKIPATSSIKHPSAAAPLLFPEALVKAHPQPVLVGLQRGRISTAPKLAASTFNDLFYIIRKYQ